MTMTVEKARKHLPKPSNTQGVDRNKKIELLVAAGKIPANLRDMPKSVRAKLLS